MILQIQHIHKRFHNHVALRDVSFGIPEGVVFGLLGPNGAGKTTLIRIITRIFMPDEGQILFRGKPHADEYVARIGYLPEERGLYRKMEVYEHAVYLGMLKGLNRGKAKEKVEYWMKRWEMMPWKKKKIQELSKGMQQKVQIMASLLHEPELLILDEPFSGFDPVNAALLKEEIINLKNSGTTILFSSHNMNNVEEICDEIVLINKSEKVLEGKVREIQHAHFENTFDFEFEGNVMGFTNALWSGGEVLFSSQIGNRNTVRVRLSPGVELNDVIGSVLPVCRLKEIRQVLPSLHDIFLKTVTGKDKAISSITQTE
ncbi:MAG: ATP-binding cassette domain-containing protein [Bacteroidia bacterium]|nr:ATP-binding cassette domain-containing protein [Bacteroidia bacterium]